jgi:LysR substrate binding domain
VRGYGIAAALEKCRSLPEVHVERADTGGCRKPKPKSAKNLTGLEGRRDREIRTHAEKLLNSYVDYLKAQGRRSHVGAQGIFQKQVKDAHLTLAYRLFCYLGLQKNSVQRGQIYVEINTLTLSVLAGHVMGLPGRTFGVCRLLDEAMLREGLENRPFLQVNSIEMAKAFVRAGMGLTVLPEFAVRAEKERGEYIGVPQHDKRGSLSATLVLCTHRDCHLSAATRRVLIALNNAMIET